MGRGMGASKHIAILVHRHGSFDDPAHFLLKEIAGVWLEQGHAVSVLHGPGEAVEVDLVINHVDLTIVPVDHLAFMRLFPRVLNAAVVDISKRVICSHLVKSGDAYQGPVIAKSNLNAAGAKEAELALQGQLPSSYLTVFDKYQVFDSPCDVPNDIWQSRGIVVERFLPERIGGYFCLRTWVFFGDRETNSLSYAEVPVIKQRDVIRREVVEEIPDRLREIREELGFDYGKFDYAIVDGEVVLYDANRTPTLGTFSREDFLPRVRHYAEGLAAFL
jgi:hypothetical protein